jgi:hypothetical protein
MATMIGTTDNVIVKRRQFADERAERLRDPRQRHMGIDKAALDEQVAEKERIRAAETDRDAFYGEQALQMDKHACLLQGDVDRVRRTRNVEVEQYRDTYQKKHAAREWDLNNPRHILDTLPARVSDTDPRCGPSSGQAFAGEDLAAGTRALAQKQQLADWALEQMEEKAMKKWVEKDLDRQYEERAAEVAYRTHLIEEQTAAQRRQMAVTTAEFNRRLAEQQRQQGALKKWDNTQKNLEEIDNMLNSDVLREEIEGTARSVADFKGMTEAQKARIAAEQQAQRDAMREAKMTDAENEKRRDMQAIMDTRMALALDRQRERERREQLNTLAGERQDQATMAASKKRELDIAYTNGVGEDFQKHFGRCYR